MVNLQRAKELMRIERECVTHADVCGRDCAQCDLMQDTNELLEAYDLVLAALETISKWEDDGK